MALCHGFGSQSLASHREGLDSTSVLSMLDAKI